MRNANPAVRTSSRRLFLRQGLGLIAAASTLSIPAVAKVAESDRRLRLANAHTWEKIDVVYWSNGAYIDESLAQINHLMRDHRANKSMPIDPKLLDIVHRLYRHLNTGKRIHILSGYRTPETNAALRKRSSGVAKYSLHMEARAVDINILGFTALELQQEALSLQAGGVGYYPRSGFVHLDTGRVRQWTQA